VSARAWDHSVGSRPKDRRNSNTSARSLVLGPCTTNTFRLLISKAPPLLDPDWQHILHDRQERLEVHTVAEHRTELHDQSDCCPTLGHIAKSRDTRH
jgi:hypothetical protein